MLPLGNFLLTRSLCFCPSTNVQNVKGEAGLWKLQEALPPILLVLPASPRWSVDSQGQGGEEGGLCMGRPFSTLLGPHENAWPHPRVLCPPQISASCRSAQVLLHYFVGANYSWLLVEGLYLHTLLEPTVLSERRLWPRYMLVGWGE